jgi:hypothetical protein
MESPNKTCFQCGQRGHVQPDCSLKERSQGGVDAFLRYQKAWKKVIKPKKIKPKTHHFLKFQRWLETHAEAGCICDPLLLAAQHILVQEGGPLSFEWTKMMDLSYKEMFMDIIERTRLRFSGQTTRREHDELWVQTLNQAVKAGEPADFSQIEANRVYADNKLIFRTRYLFYLFMDENSFSVRLRKKLLPSPLSNTQAERKFVRIASIGGGPVSIV